MTLLALLPWCCHNQHNQTPKLKPVMRAAMLFARLWIHSCLLSIGLSNYCLPAVSYSFKQVHRLLIYTLRLLILFSRENFLFCSVPFTCFTCLQKFLITGRRLFRLTQHAYESWLGTVKEDCKWFHITLRSGSVLFRFLFDKEAGKPPSIALHLLLHYKQIDILFKARSSHFKKKEDKTSNLVTN